MWIATTYGFYSVVTKPGFSASLVHVRTHWRSDLVQLLKAADKLDIYPIEHDPDADYHFRVVINHEQWISLALVMSDSVKEYDNFKNHIHHHPHQHKKLSVYTKIWGLLYNLAYPSTDFLRTYHVESRKNHRS